MIRANFNTYYKGLSLWGILFWSTSGSRADIVEEELSVSTNVPAACVVAPATIFTLEWDRIIILPVIDEYNINGEEYWVVYGSFMIIPMTDIYIDFNSMEVVESNDILPISNTLYEQLTWSLITSELFDSTVTATSPSPPPGESSNAFFIDRSTTTNDDLYMYAGAAVSYYFGILGQMLYDLGLIGHVAHTYSSLLMRAADPYFAIALFMVQLISSINLVEHNAYASALMLKFVGWRYGYTSEDSVTVRIIKETIKYGVVGFTPTSLAYYVKVLPPNPPEPPPSGQTEG